MSEKFTTNDELIGKLSKNPIFAKEYRMSELTEKIADIICGNTRLWGDDANLEAITREIAAMIEAERKPDTLTVPEAVERMVNFFSEWDIYTTCILPDSWGIKIMLNGWKTTPPDYVMAIENGETPAAVKDGLEDLFVTILGGEK